MESLKPFLAFVTVDYLIVFGIWAAASFLALKRFRTHIIALSFALPIGILIAEFIREAKWIGESVQSAAANPIAGVAILFVFVALAFWLVMRLMGYDSGFGNGVVSALATGTACTALLLAAWHIIPGTDSIWNFSSVFDTVFARSYVFWWFLGAYILLGFFRR
jgi:hypothetical protein